MRAVFLAIVTVTTRAGRRSSSALIHDADADALVRARRIAEAALFRPYAAWFSFASVRTGAIFYLNRA
jgi:hypothetical protein